MFFIIPGISWGIIKDPVDWYRKLTPPCELIVFRAKKKTASVGYSRFPSFSFSQFFTFFPLSSYWLPAMLTFFWLAFCYTLLRAHQVMSSRNYLILMRLNEMKPMNGYHEIGRSRPYRCDIIWHHNLKFFVEKKKKIYIYL